MKDLTCKKLVFKLSLVLIALGVSSFSTYAQNVEPGSRAQSDEVHQLWSIMVEPTLHQEIRTGEQGQNFGASMMVPLHAAFKLRDPAWQHSYADHFARTAANFLALPQEDLGRLQYLYVASQFMVLAKESGQTDLIPRTLPGLVYSDIMTVWTKKPAWQWGRPPFPGGARERTLWRLNNRKAEKSYYRAINDVDLFVFAIAGDIKALITDPVEIKAWSPTLDDILAIARRTFTQEVVSQSDGGWLFQPGVWTDHPEYQYAGNMEVHPGMKPVPVPNLSADSSHSLRYPLWLTSLMKAYPPDSEGRRFYEGLRRGLDQQFFNKVLVKPTSNVPCYRLNNFMDGLNGVYRWNYESLGPGRGYGPFELSGTLMLGWWVFLDSDRIRSVYHDLATTFPWPNECIKFYLGPAPAKGYAPNAFDPNSSSMRLWHLSVLLSSRL